MGELRVLRTFSKLASCLCAQLTRLLSLFLLCLFPVLPRHGAKLACSFPKPLLPEKVPLPRWQRLHPDAEAVSHLFLIRSLASAGREPRRKPEGCQTRREFWISVEKVAEEEEVEPAPASRAGSKWTSNEPGRAGIVVVYTS
jgi:hypothetical protein